MKLNNEFNLTKEKLDAKIKQRTEEFNELKAIAKDVFNSPNGLKLYRAMKGYCKVGTVNFNLDPQGLAYNQALINFYNTFFGLMIEEDEYERRNDSKL